VPEELSSFPPHATRAVHSTNDITLFNHHICEPSSPHHRSTLGLALVSRCSPLVAVL